MKKYMPLERGLGGVVIAVLPYVIHPKTAVLGRAGGDYKSPGFNRSNIF